jgi:hypothetical protein
LSKNKSIEMPIYHETISRDRFMLISRFLHFANDKAIGDDSDKLKKIRPMIMHFSDKFSGSYYPAQNIVIDESLMKFRG